MRSSSCIMALLLVAGLARGGDRGLDSRAAPAQQGAPRPTVQLLVEAQQPGGPWYSLTEGSSLRSGDWLRMKVKVDQAQFVYVLQFFSDGSARVLHPSSGHQTLPPGQEVELPGQGHLFRVDDVPGEEHVYLITSTRPIEQADRAAAALIEDLRTSSGKAEVKEAASAPPSAPSGAGAPPAASAAAAPARAKKSGSGAGAPPASPQKAGPTQVSAAINSRGMVVAPARATSPTTVQADEEGVVIYRFSFNHLP